MHLWLAWQNLAAMGCSDVVVVPSHLLEPPNCYQALKSIIGNWCYRAGEPLRPDLGILGLPRDVDIYLSLPPRRWSGYRQS